MGAARRGAGWSLALSESAFRNLYAHEKFRRHGSTALFYKSVSAMPGGSAIVKSLWEFKSDVFHPRHSSGL